MSKIEWTGITWNPSTGCDKISPGCGLPRRGSDDEATGLTGGCYALTMAKRLKAMGQTKYENDGDPRTSGPGFGLTLHPSALDLPYTWRKPQVVFVNSMSDLFHGGVPLDFIRRVFEVIADTPRHTYQVLTKRSTRLLRLAGKLDWPPNLWMGVSIEHADYTYRADDLGETGAAVRFLSCEPLIGTLPELELASIDWVITGGESGPGARPAHPDWFRSIRELCNAADVPYFHKQHGAYAPVADRPKWGDVWVRADGSTVPWDSDDGHIRHGEGDFRLGDAVLVRKVGKKAAGRLLDGRTWDEFPQAAEVSQ